MFALKFSRVSGWVLWPSLAMLSACSSYSTPSVTRLITPYEADIVQGNFVSKEQMQWLKPGLKRAQVKELLGTPLVSSLFHGDRWDYVFTFKHKGNVLISHRLAVYFEGDVVSRFEGDDMPSEAEFVSSLQQGRKTGRIPPLEMSVEMRSKFESNAKPATSSEQDGFVPPVYPPLEPARRSN